MGPFKTGFLILQFFGVLGSGFLMVMYLLWSNVILLTLKNDRNCLNLLPNMYHDNRSRLSARHTLLPSIYHDNRGRLSAHHTLLPNMYHDNRGRLSARHTLLPYMYHDNRGRPSARHTFRGRYRFLIWAPT